MSAIEVKVPDIGDFTDVPVIEVLVKAGDAIKAEDSLVTLESDKATMDVPAPAAGVVKELRVKVGDKVSEGSVILILDSAAAAASSKPASTASAAPPAASAATAPAAAPKAASSAASTVVVKVPDIGDFSDVPVIEVFVKVGDTVKAEDSLVTLESDKATMDVPAPAAGVVKEVSIKVGDKVSEGTPIVVLESSAAGASAPAAPAAAASAAAPAACSCLASTARSSGRRRCTAANRSSMLAPPTPKTYRTPELASTSAM